MLVLTIASNAKAMDTATTCLSAGSTALLYGAGLAKPVYDGAHNLYSYLINKKNAQTMTAPLDDYAALNKRILQESRKILVEQQKHAIKSSELILIQHKNELTIIQQMLENSKKMLNMYTTLKNEVKIDQINAEIANLEKQIDQKKADIASSEQNIQNLTNIPEEQTTCIPTLYDFANTINRELLGHDSAPITVQLVGPSYPSYYGPHTAFMNSNLRLLSIAQEGTDELLGALLCKKIIDKKLNPDLLAYTEKILYKKFAASRKKADEVIACWAGIISHELGHLKRNSALKTALACCAAPLVVAGAACAITSAPAVASSLAAMSILTKLGIGIGAGTIQYCMQFLLKRLYYRHDEHQADSNVPDEPALLQAMEKIMSLYETKSIKLISDAAQGRAEIPEWLTTDQHWIPHFLNTIKIPDSAFKKFPQIYEFCFFMIDEHPSCHARAAYFRSRLEKLAAQQGITVEQLVRENPLPETYIDNIEESFKDALENLPDTTEFYDAQETLPCTLTDK